MRLQLAIDYCRVMTCNKWNMLYVGLLMCGVLSCQISASDSLYAAEPNRLNQPGEFQFESAGDLSFGESILDDSLILNQVLYSEYANGTIIDDDDDKPLTPSPDEKMKEAEAKAAKLKKKEPNKFGEAPKPDERPINFLRTEAVLLKPGQAQFDLGIRYDTNSFQYPTIDGLDIVTAEIRQRDITTPLGIRYGVVDNLQFFAATVAGFSSQELFTPFTDFHDNSSGIGDVNFGFNYAMPICCEDDPQVVWTIEANAPTGNFPSILYRPSAGLGSGHWAAGASVLLIQTYDPLVVFGGVGYRYILGRERDDFYIEPGHQAFYQLGVGFSVNSDITLSTTLFGSVRNEIQVNGQGIPGTDSDSINLRFALTKTDCHKIIEPFIVIGVTDIANDASLGINWTFY